MRAERSARLICSDVVARGLDVASVQAVINFDAPNYIKNYVHRVGRTGRAGREGQAYTLVEPKEVQYGFCDMHVHLCRRNFSRI